MAFVKPYLDGWENGEVGNTPITAEILNNNYDAFLVEVSEDIGKFDFATTPTAGYALIWDATAGKYKPTAIPASVDELNDLSDVDAESPSVGQVLKRGEILGEAFWINSWLHVNDIKDIILNNPDTGDILVCEMTPDPIIEVPKWKNKPFPVSANPSDTATATLTKIKINDVIYGISGGGGGGSTVSYTAVVQSGTKLGTITIDGVGYDVYAPTVNVPTKTSDLTNDSNFVADASYVHTDNNYSTNDKNKVADLVQVVANPSSGTSAGNLTSISVGGTKYDIPSGGGGGTTVVANPSGTATEELEKLQVGSTIYSIPEGGGGGSELYSGKTLVRKTKTYTGDGTVPLVITFTEKPLFIYDIYGPGLNETNTVRMYPFTYGETKAAGRYINNNSTSGLIGYTIAYSNNDLTMSITSDPGDAGACLNNNGSTFTIEYLVENDLNKITDITGTLAAGATSITLSDSSITTSSTIEVFDSLDIPYNTKILSTGSITLTFDAQQTAMDVKVRVS